MRITLRGKSLEVERMVVERAMRGIEPDPLRKHGAEVGGRVYPVKQVLRETLDALGITDLSVLDFTSADARNILRRLGFRLFEERVSSRPKRRR